MAQIVTFNMSVTGTAPSLTAAASGDTAAVSDKHFLMVHNGGGSGITVTIDVPGNGPNGLALPDTVVTVANGADAQIPLDAYYANPADGLAHITWSATTSVTRAVVKR